MAKKPDYSKRVAKGCKLTNDEREARLHFAIQVISSTPSAYQQAKILMRQYEITRRAAVNILARARAKMRVDRELDAESSIDIAHALIRKVGHKAMEEGKYKAALKSAELLLQIGGESGAVQEQLTGGITFEIVNGNGSNGNESPPQASPDDQREAGGAAEQPG